MGLFKDSLRTWFYGSGAKAITNTSNVCLLDASGNPIGCDTIQRVSAFVLNPNEFVDMGLPSGTLWAKRNLGALKETDNGYYFSWGNLTGHSEGSGYDFSQAKYDTTPAASISANLTLAQDAARANLGKAWRMPTKEQFVELLNSNYTEFVDANGTVITGTNKLTTYNNASGLLLRSKANGNTLFIPAAGLSSSTTVDNKGTKGRYWNTYYNTSNGGALAFDSSNVNPNDNSQRRLGFSIRPVI